MYLRFVCAERHPHQEAELGLYRALLRIDWDRQPLWLKLEFEEAWRVACRLGVPPVLKCGQQTRRGRQSLCWLKGSGADWVLPHVRHLAWAVTEAGTPIQELRTRNPGTVIWEDEDQVVAVPGRDLRRRFRRRLRHRR
ncbi:MAG: hypothetical protein AAFV86_12725 [Pseudomonadota bacterium]